MNATLNKNIRKNFCSTAICGSTGVSVTQEQIERPGLASLLEFADETGEVNLDSVLNYRITQESLPMLYVDGILDSSSWIHSIGNQRNTSVLLT